MEHLVIENIPISFSRKNIKNINIRIVEPNGEVKVSAPYLISMNRVEKFITERKEWIINSQQKIIDKSHSKNNIMDRLFNLESLNSNMTLPELKKLYADELLLQAKPIFEKWEQVCGLKPNKVVVKWVKTMWGSCNKKDKKIMLNGQLVAMDKKYLDYVILHELTHLKYSNHGEKFKNFMTKYMPNWKEIRRELNG